MNIIFQALKQLNNLLALFFSDNLPKNPLALNWTNCSLGLLDRFYPLIFLLFPCIRSPMSWISCLSLSWFLKLFCWAYHLVPFSWEANFWPHASLTLLFFLYTWLIDWLTYYRQLEKIFLLELWKHRSFVFRLIVLLLGNLKPFLITILPGSF